MLIILVPITGGVCEKIIKKSAWQREKKRETETDRGREGVCVCVCETDSMCVRACECACVCVCVKAMINFRSQSRENMMYNQLWCYCWVTDHVNVGFQLALFTSAAIGKHTLLTSNKPYQCNELDKCIHFWSLQYGYMMYDQFLCETTYCDVIAGQLIA